MYLIIKSESKEKNDQRIKRIEEQKRIRISKKIVKKKLFFFDVGKNKKKIHFQNDKNLHLANFINFKNNSSGGPYCG